MIWQADDPWGRPIGFVIRDNIGIGIVNPLAIIKTIRL